MGTSPHGVFRGAPIPVHPAREGGGLDSLCSCSRTAPNSIGSSSTGGTRSPELVLGRALDRHVRLAPPVGDPRRGRGEGTVRSLRTGDSKT